MRTKHWLGIILIAFMTQTWAQLAPNTYWIQFNDKNNSTFSLDNPEDYLSERSIQRRLRYNIDVDSTDLPLNKWYIDSLKSKGAVILNHSKWLNGVAIYTDNLTSLNSIYNLDFVDEARSSSNAFSMNFTPYTSSKNMASIETDAFNYGSATDQISLHNGQVLHNHNYLGQGMQIAVIDAGFKDLDITAAFDSIFLNDQIIGTWDFVSNDTNVYDDHYHGKAVLSTIAANLPGEMLGTAPKAKFLLLRSENSASEYKIEEINWATAAEFADSSGVDLITTSLGYQDYSSPCNQYQWDDLDGQTAPITRATDMAAQKGIMMVTSAGNEGTSSWKKITPPADANYALTVGACNTAGDYASLSSKGYTADGRIKPNICSVGLGATVITTSNPSSGNGTSFSTPIMAGLIACLWQVNINKTNFEIMDLVQRHSHQALNPDSLMGYGIPNFSSAYDELTTDINTIESGKEQLLKIYPSVFKDHINLKYFSPKKNVVQWTLYDMQGLILMENSFIVDSNHVSHFTINQLDHLPSGVYLLKVTSDNYSHVKKIIKQ